jgi:hypothetical protein
MQQAMESFREKNLWRDPKEDIRVFLADFAATLAQVEFPAKVQLKLGPWPPARVLVRLSDLPGKWNSIGIPKSVFGALPLENLPGMNSSSSLRGSSGATTCAGDSRATPRSYSVCSIVIGSRRMARSAGIQLAASATRVSTTETATKVSRSFGDTPKSNPAIR